MIRRRLNFLCVFLILCLISISCSSLSSPTKIEIQPIEKSPDTPHVQVTNTKIIPTPVTPTPVIATQVIITKVASQGVEAPIPGAWLGKTEFGEFGFTVNPGGKTINKIVLSFDNYTCGHEILSIGTKTEFKNPLPINNGQISVEIQISSSQPGAGDLIFKFEGGFSKDGKSASGDWTGEVSGFNCTPGKWEVSSDFSARANLPETQKNSGIDKYTRTNENCPLRG